MAAMDGRSQQRKPAFQEKLLYSVKEAAELLGISARTLFKLRKNRELPATMIGGSVRFHRDTLQGYIARQLEGGN